MFCRTTSTKVLRPAADVVDLARTAVVSVVNGLGLDAQRSGLAGVDDELTDRCARSAT
jgi:hypothetical protein